MLASPRSLSQLATSFIAYLRQGIHTHALSSLTIKFTLDTVSWSALDLKYGLTRPKLLLLALHAVYCLHDMINHAAAVGDAIATCVAHQYSIVKELFLKNSGVSIQESEFFCIPTTDFWLLYSSFLGLVGLGRIELPTSPLSGVRSSQLSYRPKSNLVELVGIEPATS